jgi:hypothetical protein
MKLQSSGRIFEKYSNFMKICPVGTEWFDADGQTDEANRLFFTRNIASTPKKGEKDETVPTHAKKA